MTGNWAPLASCERDLYDLGYFLHHYPLFESKIENLRTVIVVENRVPTIVAVLDSHVLHYDHQNFIAQAKSPLVLSWLFIE